MKPASAIPESAPASASAAALYTTRRDAARAEVARLHRRHLLLGSIRLGWAALGAVMVWLGYAHGLRPWAWLLLPLAGFIATARIHARVLARSAARWRAIHFYEHGLARLEERWAGVRPRTPEVDTAASLFAGDLDLFGPASLFELLCTARTTPGEQTLATWLLQPAPLRTITTRQAAVGELRDQLDLRERLATEPGPDLVALPADMLAAWGESSIAQVPTALRFLAPLLSLLSLAAAVYSAWARTFTPFMVMLAINWALTQRLQRSLKPLFSAAQDTARALSISASLLASLEETAVTAPELQRLQAELRGAGLPASAAIRRLGWLALAAEQRANDYVRIFDVIFLYSVQLGLFIQAWRARFGPQLRPWITALGEWEALLSLASYSFEHPADPFPDCTAPAPSFTAAALGHPLLPGDGGVRNPVTLDAETRMLLISGSNMSGKSTLLRAVGVATVMAMAGAPVRARSLRLSPLTLAASIQVQDSLQAGHSRFYAEILRLRAVCELARTHPPVLFLLDELLAGTNSHDRLAGATGAVEALLRFGSIGLLSTHDLALTGLGAEHAHLLHNVHFEDTITDGEIHFDYTLREGVVERSNGLALMRLIGLDV